MLDNDSTRKRKGEFHVYPYKTLKLRISPSKFYNNIFSLSKLKLRIYSIHLVITYLSFQITLNYIFTQFITEAERGGAESLLTVGPGASVTVRYHLNFGPHEDFLRLEALDEALLSHLLHGTVTIRGTHDDAVLCTPSSTYAMKFVTTSN